jgi:hypothetical protein
MNQLEIESNHWVERYLSGRLSETDAQQLEAYWIEHPELIRDLENCARIKTGLASLRSRGQLAPLLRSSWWTGGLRLLTLAASVALVAIGAALWNGAHRPVNVALGVTAAALPRIDGGFLPPGERYTIMRMRGAAASDAMIQLPETPQALELRILPEAAPTTSSTGSGAAETRRYSLWLIRDDATATPRRVGQADGFVSGTDGFITVFVDSRTLQPARYRLRLEPDAGQGFIIDVRSPAKAP